ncbi:hypothetical protein Taro_043848, partial [Colocasia esculenta]|nr:hypothetical protein [Colocasia esculenta]
MRVISCSGRNLQIAADLPVAIQVATGGSGAIRRPDGLARTRKGTWWRGPPHSRCDLAADRDPPVIAAYRAAAISGTVRGDDFYFNFINEAKDNNVDPEEDPHLQLTINELYRMGNDHKNKDPDDDLFASQNVYLSLFQKRAEQNEYHK